MEENKYIGNEINDLRRERQILRDEMLSDQHTFADNVRDYLGEEIKEALRKEKKTVNDEPVKKKSKLKFFLDKLSAICQ